MNGGGEGGGNRPANWGLMVAVASLVLTLAQFWASLNDQGREKSVELEKRLMRIECKLRIGECEGAS